MLAEGTYRTACGSLVHCRIDPAGRLWATADDERGHRPVKLATTATPLLLSDDPDWPCGPEPPGDPVREPD